MIPYSTLIIEKPKTKTTKRIDYVNKLKKVFNANIGKKISLTYYIKFESCTKTYSIKGNIEKCFALEDVIIKTNNGIEFVNIYSIMSYTISISL